MKTTKQPINCDIRDDIREIIRSSLMSSSLLEKRFEEYIIGIREQDKKQKRKLDFEQPIQEIIEKMKVGDTLGFSIKRKHFSIKRDE